MIFPISQHKYYKKQYKAIILPYIINAAKGVIPKKIQEKERSTIGEWYKIIECVYKIEYLSSREEEQVGRFESIRESWIAFKIAFKKTRKYMDA